MCSRVKPPLEVSRLVDIRVTTCTIRRLAASRASGSTGRPRRGLGGARSRLAFEGKLCQVAARKKCRGGSSAGLTFLAPCRTAPERHLRLPPRRHGLEAARAACRPRKERLSTAAARHKGPWAKNWGDAPPHALRRRDVEWRRPPRAAPELERPTDRLRRRPRGGVLPEPGEVPLARRLS